MCLFPIKIVTPYNRIALNGGQPLYMEVPCNNCAECKDKKRLEWHFRTYHQCEDFVSSGGFIYYVTLTYADEHLPMLSHFYDISTTPIKDFSCFNHEHFKLFLKRLRRFMQYHYKGHTVKYFLTSEYGTDERFTHRPHHHILLFVKSFNEYLINPLYFSRIVSQCWNYGRTDGLPYEPVSYVEQNIFADIEVGNYNTNLLRVCNYISKYITKDSDFQKQIDNRISLLKHYIEDEEQLKKLIRNISMFHRQSQGFGLSYVKYLSSDEYQFIYDNGACRLQDPNKVILTIPIPLYYKRKLFYKLHKVKDEQDEDKYKYFWIPTDKGIQYIRNNMIINIRKTENSLKTNFINLSDEHKFHVTNLLNGRSFADLAIYNLYYRYHSRDLNYLPQLLTLPFHDKLNNYEFNLYDHLESIISSKNINISDNDDYFTRNKDDNLIQIFAFDDFFSLSNYVYTDILKRLTYDQNSCPAFKHFDDINLILDGSKSSINSNKQKAFEHIESMKKRYKYLLSQL